MKVSVLMVLLLLNIGQASAADWVFRPVSGGRLEMTQQGGAEQGPEMLVRRQAEKESLTLQVTPAGMGRCENGVLTGSGPLEEIQIPLIPVVHGVAQSGRQVRCGETLFFDAAAESQMTGVKALQRKGRIASATLPAALSGQRILLGYINFVRANSSVDANAIYLDLSTMESSMPAVQASFDRQALRFGGVSMLRNALYNARLTIRKTVDAGDAAMPYELSFESSQQRNGSFHLKSAQGDIYVPYSIKIGNRNMAPGTLYTGTIPAGSTAADMIAVNFSLSGKDIIGLAAGTRLTDTLTAVIKPTS